MPKQSKTIDKSLAKFVTYEYVMATLTVSRSTVDRIVERGELESKLVSPGCRRITRSSWDAYLANI